MRDVLSNPKQVEEMEDIARSGEWLHVCIPESMGNFLWLPWVLIYHPIRCYGVNCANSSDCLQLFSLISSLGSYWFILPHSSPMDSSLQSI
jgi:hypothetical protein